jgi:hypothetical protein
VFFEGDTCFLLVLAVKKRLMHQIREVIQGLRPVEFSWTVSLWAPLFLEGQDQLSLPPLHSEVQLK